MEIKKVAVLGSGVMGAQIAAHIANAKIPVYMFDMNQELSEKGKQASLKIRPHAFFEPKNADLITPMNYDDHLSKIEECDWVIEVIAERFISLVIFASGNKLVWNSMFCIRSLRMSIKVFTLANSIIISTLPRSSILPDSRSKVWTSPT